MRDPIEASQDLGPQSSGPGNGKERDHERRIQAMERNEVKMRAELVAIRKAHEDLRKDLFGDPDRRDDGGLGAFANLENVIKAEGQRRLARVTRLWQVAGGILIGIVVAGATYLLTLAPHQ